MSLARAFTTRRVRQTLEFNKDHSGSDGLLHRSKSTKAFASSIRNKISAPVELTHTTNMLSYNAPDIYPTTTSASSTSSTATTSPTASTKSDDESDSVLTRASTPPTSPDSDAPYPDDKRSLTPEPNHLSCYFTPPKQTASQFPTNAASGTITPQEVVPDLDAPAIPKRSPSHTKKNYEGLARHRSTSRMSEHSSRSLSSKASFSFSRSSSSSTSTSVTSSGSHGSSASRSAKQSILLPPVADMTIPPVSHNVETSESHPFGHELAKVSELVEEFGKEEPSVEKHEAPKHIEPVVVDEEERELLQQGLQKFSAEDYISEIQGLVASFLADVRPVAPVWI